MARMNYSLNHSRYLGTTGIELKPKKKRRKKRKGIYLHTKYDGKCSVCELEIPQGTEVRYNPEAKTIKHIKCKRV